MYYLESLYHSKKYEAISMGKRGKKSSIPTRPLWNPRGLLIKTQHFPIHGVKLRLETRHNFGRPKGISKTSGDLRHVELVGEWLEAGDGSINFPLRGETLPPFHTPHSIHLMFEWGGGTERGGGVERRDTV